MIRFFKNNIAGEQAAKGIVIGLLLMAPIVGLTQNINSPNRRGPLGAEVNMLTGNLFLPREDFHVPTTGFDLKARFFYSSYNYDENLGFGNGWRF